MFLLTLRASIQTFFLVSKVLTHFFSLLRQTSMSVLWNQLPVITLQLVAIPTVLSTALVTKDLPEMEQFVKVYNN